MRDTAIQRTYANMESDVCGGSEVPSHRFTAVVRYVTTLLNYQMFVNVESDCDENCVRKLGN
jgi:hypothetical protein